VCSDFPCKKLLKNAFACVDILIDIFRCEALMVMLPVSSDPFDLETALTLTDGNEALLREVRESSLLTNYWSEST